MSELDAAYNFKMRVEKVRKRERELMQEVRGKRVRGYSLMILYFVGNVRDLMMEVEELGMNYLDVN